MADVLIRLTTPEAWGTFTLTHAKLCRVDYEVQRPPDAKPGWVSLWYAKGYMEDGVFREAPGVPGVNVLRDEPELPADKLKPCVQNLDQMTVDLGVIDGTVVEE